MCSTTWKREVAPPPLRGVHIWLPVPTRNGRVLAAGAVLALILAALAIPPIRHTIFHPSQRSMAGPAGIPPLSQGKYVAVLPFHVLGDQESLGYVAEGLGEALSARLFQLKDVHVASPTAAAKAGENDPLEKIARELGANLLVHGTVQGTKSQDNVQKIAVVVHLENVSTGQRLWSGQVSGLARGFACPGGSDRF